MSTNMYWHVGETRESQHCRSCSCTEPIVLHIGKYAGAALSFEGHFGPYKLTSWAEWQAALRSSGHVETEYGSRVPTETFIAEVEGALKSDRRRQYDWVRDHHRLDDLLDRVEPGYYWLDADGFTFHGGEFS